MPQIEINHFQWERAIIHNGLMSTFHFSPHERWESSKLLAIPGPVAVDSSRCGLPLKAFWPVSRPIPTPLQGTAVSPHSSISHLEDKCNAGAHNQAVACQQNNDGIREACQCSSNKITELFYIVSPEHLKKGIKKPIINSQSSRIFFKSTTILWNSSISKYHI